MDNVDYFRESTLMKLLSLFMTAVLLGSVFSHDTLASQSGSQGSTGTSSPNGGDGSEGPRKPK